ncbi:serine/threonine-protein kinase ppk34 [Folsomia candida]|uniref:serine/threonine-protein kinase ppk34 n=1 Tax=Folsomia candida TaxID=158441 RepID=UPI00160532D6|nr:serine/threonine-protein kinase ppk34 [Folsomia candida]
MRRLQYISPFSNHPRSSLLNLFNLVKISYRKMEVGPAVPSESINSWLRTQTLKSFLGHGSFGYVFQAVDRLEKSTAIKIIFVDPTDKTSTELECEKLRLSREYKLISGKKHDNLIEILASTEKPFAVGDVQALLSLPCLQNNYTVLDKFQLFFLQAQRGTQIPTLCIQMEVCGMSLRQWLNRNNQADDPKLHPVRKQIVKDMYEGLKYLHNNKIMHRDFRPENIMFSFSSTEEESAFPVKVGDFGLCRKLHSEETVTNTLTTRVGNNTYRAPETKFSDYGIPADLYSFGLVWWEVVQAIRQKDTASMFDGLVHDSDSSLVVEANWWFPNWANIIIRLTKRRVKDRITGHDEIRIESTVYNVESHVQFSGIQDLILPGDIVNLNISDEIRKAYGFKVDNVAFNGVNPSVHQHLSLHIRGNSCTINNLNLGFLDVSGNDGSFSNVTCDDLFVSGNRNKFSNIEILHVKSYILYGRPAITIRGKNNVLKSVKCTNSHTKPIKNNAYPPYARWTPFAQKYGPICIHLAEDSPSCTVENANFYNAFITGTGHVLKEIRCTNAIEIIGKGHTIERVDAANRIDKST